MARTEATVTELTANSSTDDPAGVALNAGAGNGHFVQNVPLEQLYLEIEVTNVAGGDITVLAGDNPPALDAGQGDLVVTFAQNDVKLLGPFTSARFVQAGADDGRLHVDVATGVTGTIKAFHLPRTA